MERWEKGGRAWEVEGALGSDGKAWASVSSYLLFFVSFLFFFFFLPHQHAWSKASSAWYIPPVIENLIEGVPFLPHDGVEGGEKRGDGL